MRKTYILQIEGKNRDRLLEAAKHDIRKYVKRERARPLPPGVDFWDFNCQLGTTADTARPVHFAELIPSVDQLAAQGDQFYVEVVTAHGIRGQKAGAAFNPGMAQPAD